MLFLLFFVGGLVGVSVVLLLVVLLLVLVSDVCVFGANMVIGVGVGVRVTAGAGCIGWWWQA